MNTIYTAGYSGHTPEQLRRAAERLNADVMDIRLSPRSRVPGWNEGPLRQLLGTRYMHVQCLGNANFKTGGPIQIVNLEAGERIVRQHAQKKPLILLCGCKEFASCHRHTVARHLVPLGYQVQELDWSNESPAMTFDPVALPCLTHSGDVVVTVPKAFEYRGKKGLEAWISEGDAAGEEWSGEEWDFSLYGATPKMQSGDRVYVVYNGKLRGYSPLVRIEHDIYDKRYLSLIRHGDAVAVTVDEHITGFRGFRYRWWPREIERDFPDWRTA